MDTGKRRPVTQRTVSERSLSCLYVALEAKASVGGHSPGLVRCYRWGPFFFGL
jgi:hypothetical protein